MLKKTVFHGVLSISLFLFSGCEVGPDYEKPKLNLPIQTNARADEEVAEFLVEGWWRIFKDTTLDDLEKQALKNNADIKQAIANIAEAAALADVSLADYFPSIAATATGMQAGLSKSAAASQGGKITRAFDYVGTIGASYELDFFGKYRRANEAARANLLASHASKEVVLLTVTSEVAKTYFALRAYDAKLAIARRTLKTRQEGYLVYKSRFENGYCTEFDYLRMKAEMDSVKTTVLDLEAAAAKIENALSVLIGASPKDMIIRKTSRASTLEMLKIPTVVPSGLPSNLLARRPDVVAAEGQLIAANANIGQAIAANFPSFSLTAAFGFEGSTLGHVFHPSNEMWSLGQSISLPLFAGGRIEGMTKVAEARYKKALAGYEKTVQMAFRETLDALISAKKSSEIVASRTRQVDSLKKSYHIALTQKESGLIGLLDLLDVERGLLSTEMELTNALQNQLNAIVDLCKALGGGWSIERRAHPTNQKNAGNIEKTAIKAATTTATTVANTNVDTTKAIVANSAKTMTAAEKTTTATAAVGITTKTTTTTTTKK